ncbi:tyrosine-type recombinase/integrase [Streptomyces sp. NPDC057927]
MHSEIDGQLLDLRLRIGGAVHPYRAVTQLQRVLPGRSHGHRSSHESHLTRCQLPSHLGGTSAAAAKAHLSGWADTLTPHVLRHFCASELYLGGLDLLGIQEVLGHSWIATTMRYIHVQQTRVEDAWVSGQQRAAKRLEGLMG